MNNSPLITVIIPTHNSSASVAACIDSIESQSFKNYEALFMDGLSSDQTMDIIKARALRNDKIRFLSEKDDGIYDAMNKGIKIADGEWLLFLGSDDRLLDNAVLEKIAPVLESSDADMVYGNVKVVGDAVWAHDGDIYDGPFTVQKLFSKNICHQSVFYRKSLFNKIGNYNTNYKIAADWDLNHRCFANGSVQYADQTISAFYAGGESSQLNRNDLFSSEDLVLNLKKYHGTGYFSHWYAPYSWVFYNLACKRLSEKNYFGSLYFLFFALVHSKKKMATLKNYLNNLSGRNKPVPVS